MKLPAASIAHFVLILAATACAPPANQEPATDETASPRDVEAAARAFLDHSHAFEYVAMRAAATSDFEILIFGRRMDLDAFEAFLREMEESRGGEELDTYDLLDLNTEIVGDVAYTSWGSTHWLEAAIFVRSGDQWLVDRAFAIPVEAAPQP
jgi:hypothetical protein